MEYSLSDLKAIMNERDDGVLGSNGFLWIILIFLFFLAFNGNGFGNWGGNANGGLAQVERDVLITSCETQKNVMQSQYDTLLGFKDLSYQNQLCCCNLQQAIHSEGEQTRALIQENTIQELRDRLTTANNALTTQTIINQVVEQIRPCAKPAYLTCSPYLSYSPFNNNCGGCGNF